MTNKIHAACTALNSMLSHFDSNPETFPEQLNDIQLKTILSIIDTINWEKSFKVQLTFVQMSEKNKLISKIIRQASSQLQNHPQLQILNNLIDNQLIYSLYLNIVHRAEKNDEGQIVKLSPCLKNRMKALRSLPTLMREAESLIVVTNDNTLPLNKIEATAIVKQLLEIKKFKFSPHFIEKAWNAFTNIFVKEPPSLSIEQNHLCLLSQVIIALINKYRLDFGSLGCSTLSHAIELITSFGEEAEQLKNFTYEYDQNLHNYFGETFSVQHASDLKRLCPQLKLLILNEVDVPLNSFRELCNLSNLKLLKLTNCEINEIPNEISKLNKLTEVDLSENYLERLPETIGGLTSLKYLNVFKNRLSTLPSSFSALQALQKLILTGNKFTKIPPQLRHLSSLVILKLNSNYIENLDIPLNLPISLNELDLAHNSIHSITNEINTLRNLTSLDLHQNHIQELPRVVEELRTLEYINYSGNRIRDIPNFVRSIPEVIMSSKSRELTFKRDQLETNFLEVLEELVLALPQDSSKIRIKYALEPGIDQGGLTNEFLSDIFDLLTKKVIAEGYLSWSKCAKFTKKPEDLCFWIGQLLGYVYKQHGSSPIGIVFGVELFQGLVNCADEALDKVFDDLTISELVSFLGDEYKEALCIEEILEYVNSNGLSASKESKSAIDNLFTGILQEPPKSFSPAAVERVRKALIEACEEKIRPLYLIACGFRNNTLTWAWRKQVGPVRVEKIIQGVSDRNRIISSILFVQIYSSQKRWINEWLDKAPNEKFYGFVKSVIASYTLPVGANITIKRGPHMRAITCGKTLEIPPSYTQEEIIEELENPLLIFNTK